MSKGQLFYLMIACDITNDLVNWIRLFLTNRKVQLMIDGHDNKKWNIETEIPQSFLVIPILFLLYISRVFIKSLDTNRFVISLFFVDDLGFILQATRSKKR